MKPSNKFERYGLNLNLGRLFGTSKIPYTIVKHTHTDKYDEFKYNGYEWYQKNLTAYLAPRFKTVLKKWFKMWFQQRMGLIPWISRVVVGDGYVVDGVKNTRIWMLR